MATKQTDGLTDVTFNSTDNNGGTVKANGSVGGTFQSTQLSQNKVFVFGSTVVNNDSADKALEDGVFAYDNEHPVAKKVTTTLSGVPNDFLRSGASAPGTIRSIHKLEVVRTRRLTQAIRLNKFNEYTGKFDPGYPQGSSTPDDFYNISTNSLQATSTDNAAEPTRDNPGELTYIGQSVSDGSTTVSNTILVPKNDDYKPRTN